MEITDLLNRIKLSSILGPDPDSQGQPMDEIPRPNYPINMGSDTGPTVPIHSAPLDLDRPTPTQTNQPFITQPTKPSYDYTPEHEGIDQMHQLIANMPQRHKPSMMRKIFGGIEQALGGGPGAYDNVTNGPYYQEMQDWYTKFKPVEDLANQERGVNTQNRQFAQGMAANDLRQQQIDSTTANNNEKNRIAVSRVALETWKANHPNLKPQEDSHGLLFTVDLTGKVNYLLRPDGEPIKGIELTPEQKLDMNDTNNKVKIGMNDADNAAAMERVNAQQSGANQRNAASMANAMERTKALIQGRSDAATDKATAPTTQTRAMMEGAQMLLPHVPELKAMASDLDRRGLFGPIMSRVRNYAAKIGTTGDPGQVEQNFNDFVAQVSADPLINQSNDAAVGKFITSLGLMASGVGRVHGGARGGGSIQMITYMKNLLSSDSTLGMFNGRLDAVGDYMKGYAAGPNPDGKKTPLDDIIDQALKELGAP